MTCDQVEIINTYGQITFKRDGYIAGDELNIESLTCGIYWLKINSTNGRSLYKKIIKS